MACYRDSFSYFSIFLGREDIINEILIMSMSDLVTTLGVTMHIIVNI
jgi:hypothetical protein